MIILENIKKIYQEKIILDIPYLSFQKGKIYSITGYNGEGKSTLLKIIYGIESINCGKIKMEGLDLGYNPQREIFLKGTVLHNLTHPFILRDEEIPVENIKKFIKVFEMEDFLNRDIKNLSGGEKAKIQFIRTLLFKNDFILMDEPTASMDRKSTHLVEELLIQEKTNGKGVIIVTHDFIQAEKISDFILEIEETKICIKNKNIKGM
ncbi:MAG: ABC transporter ATP-binding protein [Fusobacteriaceae bacterium]